MKAKRAGQPWPVVLDRVVDVMRHFHCAEPRELEYLLGLPADTLAALFRNRSGRLPPEVVKAMEVAGVRQDFLRRRTGSMLCDSIDSGRLEVMKRQAAILLRLICRARSILSQTEGQAVTPMRVAEGKTNPVAIEEELINLLIEVLKDKDSRDSLIKFIRADIANRKPAVN